MMHGSERWVPDDELLDRFIAEQAAPDERVAVETWLAQTPAGERTVQALRQLRFGAPLGAVEHAKVWNMVEWRLGAPAPGRREMRRRYHPGVARGARGWYVAAGLAMSALLMLAGWGIGTHGGGTDTGRPPTVYRTARGERADVTLSDGSSVVLNVGSRLEVPADYASGDRVVHLTGEALFRIAHAEAHPFTVQSGGTTTRVLGTTFLVRHYAQDSQTVVAVQDGKVAVGATVLTAGRLVAVDRDGAQRGGVADLTEFSFATGMLTLPEMPLAQAIPILDRWYDADIQVGDPALAQRHIVGEFRAGSTADLRAILALTFNVRVARSGRTLTLFPR